MNTFAHRDCYDVKGLKTLAHRDKRAHEDEETRNAKARREGTGAGEKRSSTGSSSKTEDKKKKIKIRVGKQPTLSAFMTSKTAGESSGAGASRKRKVKLTREAVEQALHRLTGRNREQCRVGELLNELTRQGVEDVREVGRLLTALEEEAVVLLRDDDGETEGPLTTIHML